MIFIVPMVLRNGVTEVTTTRKPTWGPKYCGDVNNDLRFSIVANARRFCVVDVTVVDGGNQADLTSFAANPDVHALGQSNSPVDATKLTKIIAMATKAEITLANTTSERSLYQSLVTDIARKQRTQTKAERTQEAADIVAGR